MKIILYIFLITLVILVIKFSYNICFKLYCTFALHYETKKEVAKVISKDYDEEPYTQCRVKPYQEYFIKPHYIFVVCNSNKYRFNDENMYLRVQVGDVVHLCTHVGYNKNRIVKHKYFSIER